MIDLHCHSTASDGALAPAEVAALAAANGCRLLALTDHDCTDGLKQARAAAEAHGIRFISGVEISATWRERTVHIVGLDFDEADAPLQTLLAQIRQGRTERLHRIAEKLTQKGIHGAAEGALSLAANPEMVSRTHLAEWLVRQGHARNPHQAFAKYLGEGKAAAVAHRWADFAEAVAAINRAGGIAVLAHPMRYKFSATARRNLLQEFKDAGGQALEVNSGNCRPNERIDCALLADRFGLLASSGSDFHRIGGYSGGVLGISPELPPACRPVWAHFKVPFQAA